MRLSRRRFVYGIAGATTLTAGLGSWWAAVSERRSARLLRRIVDDTRRTVAPAPERPTPGKWSDDQITIAWLGHATVLINFYGVKVLTDPALASRVGVSLGIATAGLKRYVAPALTTRQLPSIDVVLLSHAHMDHMDFPSLGRVPGRPVILSAGQTTDLFGRATQDRVLELRWGQKAAIRAPAGELEVQAFEVKHWGQRWPSELARGYNGYVLRREGKALLFGGDTAHTPLFAETRVLAPFEAAIMPIGAYRPWIRNHCTPEEALDMANHAGAKYIIPIHHKTFRLSEEPFEEPIERLVASLSSEPERLALQNIGETFLCPAT